MNMSKKTSDRIEKMLKCDILLEKLHEYLLTDIAISDNEQVRFTVVDLFCMTDIKPTELYSHLKLNRQDITGYDSYILTQFLLKYQDLGQIMTIESLKDENLTYIINGERKVITEDMWQDILKQLDELNIVPYQKVTGVVSRRLVREEPLFPLIEMLKKENKSIEYIKK